MGIQSDILSGYRAIQSANNAPKIVNAANARVDNMSFVDFIFELLKMTRGRDDFENIVLKGLLTDLKNTTNIDEEIKKILKEFLMCNTAITITTDMTTIGPGIEIVIPEIDPFNVLSVDPNSRLGKYFYEGNNPNRDINYLFYKGLSASKDNPVSLKKNGVTLFSIYSQTSNTINFSFGSAYDGKHFDEWVTDYMADMKFFNISNFFSMLVDIITGALSVKANKSNNEIAKDTKLIVALKKLIGYCSDDTGNINKPQSVIPNSGRNFDISGEGYTNDITKNTTSNNDPFDFTNDELYEIASTANLLVNNQLKFLVCNPLLIQVDPNNVIDGIDNILLENQTGEFNPDGVEIYDNENVTPNVDAIQQFLNNTLINGVKSAAEIDGGDELLVNIPNIKLEFELGILKQIPYAIMKTTINPKLFTLFKVGGVVLDSAKSSFTTKLMTQPDSGVNSINIEPDKSNRFKSGDIISLSDKTALKDVYTVIDVDGDKLYLNRPLTRRYDQRTCTVINASFSKVSINSESILKRLQGVLKSIGSIITDKILQNIYTMIKDELTKVALTLLKKALKQRFNDYIAVLESLLSLLHKLGGVVKKEKCSSLLSKILKLLKMSLPMPAKRMPPMLTLMAGGLKPGMNEVVAINEMKSKLEKYGINTSQINADGSPNTYILGLETVMSTLITHIKTSSNIQTEILCAVGPGKGFSQIQ